MPDLTIRAFCLVISRSHLSLARAVAASLRVSGNPETLYVVVTDATAVDPVTLPDGIVIVRLDEMKSAGPAAMRHYFDAFELCCALKPFVVSHLFALGCERVIYLDSDILAVGSFARVWSALDSRSLLLTPHQLQPPALQHAHVTSEVDIVDLGMLNGGFSAWRRGPAAARMLDWLQSRLPLYGFCDRPGHMFVDQKLMPLLLLYFPDDVEVSRDSGLNVAYWNVHERSVRRTEAGWFAGEQPVVFFHLSGYRPAKRGMPCAYLSEESNRLLLATAPWLTELLATYESLLTRHDRAPEDSLYGYGTFDGVALNRDYRRLLFRKSRLDRGDPVFWLIWVRTLLRALKHFLRW